MVLRNPRGFFTKHVHLREIDSDIKNTFYPTGFAVFRLYTVSLAEIRDILAEMGFQRAKNTVFRDFDRLAPP